MENCIFCKIIKGEIPAQKVDENDEILVILSLQNHPLIIPKKHIENIYEMDDETAAMVMKEAVKIAKAVKNGLQADGVNLIQNNEVAAGQEVMHFHLHIKPRWHKDDVRIHYPTDPVEEEKKKSTLEKIKSVLND